MSAGFDAEAEQQIIIRTRADREQVQTAETMTNTNNNQKFNLNEECKNAINMKKNAIDK